MQIDVWENEGGFMSYSRKYYLSEDDGNTWDEVTKEEYVRAERAAGFHNTMGRPDEPATAGFSSSNYHKRGRLRYLADGE
jgi:hypothetical protein